MANYNMTSAEKYYADLAEVYFHQYQDAMEPHLKIVVAMGVIVEMESDLAEWHLKNSETEKSENQRERLNVLRKSLDSFSISADRNLQFRMVMKKMYDENDIKDQKIIELEAEINKLNKQLQGI